MGVVTLALCAVSAGASYQGTALDSTQLMIAASPKPGAEFADVEKKTSMKIMIDVS